MNTFERVRRIVAQTLNVKEEAITPQTSLTDDLDSDSLGRVEIMMVLEDTFPVDFGEEALALTTLEQIAEYIDGKLGEKA